MSVAGRAMNAARLIALAFLLVGVVLVPGTLAAPTIFTQPAEALDSGNSIVIGKGFDSACAPTTTQMQTLFTNSGWWTYGVYIGGNNISCKSNANLTAGWLNTVRGIGWFFTFFWVGDQAPCNDPTKYYLMSYDPGTAKQDGINNGLSAYQALINTFGVANQAAGTPLTYDLESYGQPSWTSACQQAVNAFMGGWTYQLHIPTPQLSGVYGSTCGSNIDALASVSPVVDFIHGASYDGNSNPSVMPCVSSGHWVNHQRLKQYLKDQSASNFGVNILVDYDCANGPTAPGGFQVTASC